MHGLPNIDDSSEWFAKHHPDLPVGSVIPDICSDCSHTYYEGELVVSRDRNDTMVYTVKSLLCRQHQPPLILVTTPKGHDRHFAVTQIRPYNVQGTTFDVDGIPEPGYF